jgi:hypothetical protein
MIRDQIVEAIKKELDRQAEANQHPNGLYVYAESNLSLGCDGYIDLQALAEAIDVALLPTITTIVAQEEIEKGDLVTWDGRKYRKP